MTYPVTFNDTNQVAEVLVKFFIGTFFLTKNVYRVIQSMCVIICLINLLY